MAWSRRLKTAKSLSLREWRDVARAVWELALANRKLAKGGAVYDILRPPTADMHEPDPALLARVAVAIPRAATIVPWRADCLRQATAASRWLLQSGIPTEIKLGARKDDNGQMSAHAWLLCGETVLIGGTVEHYQEFD